MSGRDIDHLGDMSDYETLVLLLGCKWLINFAPRGYDRTVGAIKDVLDRCEPWVFTDGLQELKFANRERGDLDAFLRTMHSMLHPLSEEEYLERYQDFLAWMEDLPKPPC